MTDSIYILYLIHGLNEFELYLYEYFKIVMAEKTIIEKQQIDFPLDQNIIHPGALKKFLRDKVPIMINSDTMRKILQDEINIESSDLLKGLLEKYPNEPSLYKMYANSLFKNGISNAAIKIYNKATKLYLENGRTLSALLTLAVQCQVSSLEESEIKQYFLELKEKDTSRKPLNKFLFNLSYQSFIDLVKNLKIHRFQSGQVIKQVGDPEDKFCFIVSGKIKDSLFLKIDNAEKVYRKPTVYLSSGDFFGLMYPFDQSTKSKSYIESVTESEILCLSKDHLRKLCANHPKIELNLIKLLGVRSDALNTNVSEELRTESRIRLRSQLGLEILLGAGANSSIHLTGYSKDVSIGGICVIIDELSISSANETQSFNKWLANSNVLVNFKIEDLEVKIPGKIKWSKPVIDRGLKTLAVGVKFTEVSPMLKGLTLSIISCINRYSKKTPTLWRLLEESKSKIAN